MIISKFPQTCCPPYRILSLLYPPQSILLLFEDLSLWLHDSWYHTRKWSAVLRGIHGINPKGGAFGLLKNYRRPTQLYHYPHNRYTPVFLRWLSRPYCWPSLKLPAGYSLSYLSTQYTILCQGTASSGSKPIWLLESAVKTCASRFICALRALAL